MKLIYSRYIFDFGHEYTIKVLHYKTFSLAEFHFHHSQFFTWKPNIRLNVSILTHKLLGIQFSCFNISLEFSFVNLLSYDYD